MSNFLRKRRRPATADKKEMKGSRYLKYALGEIVLVVLGILIALSINNWSEGQKDRRWEKQFLIDLRNELQTDLTEMKSILDIQTEVGAGLAHTLVLIEKKDRSLKSTIDSVFSNAENRNPTFFPTTSVYQTALSGSGIQNIQNSTLRYEIMHLYNHFFDRAIYNGEILDQVVEKVDWEKLKYFDSGQRVIKSWEMVQDERFIAQIDFRMAQGMFYRGILDESLNATKALIESISKELGDK